MLYYQQVVLLIHQSDLLLLFLIPPHSFWLAAIESRPIQYVRGCPPDQAARPPSAPIIDSMCACGGSDWHFVFVLARK